MNKSSFELVSIVRKAGRGYVLAAVLFCVLSFAIAVVSCYTAFSIKAAYTGLVIVLCITAFIASVSAGNAFGSRGLFVGLGSGIVYVGLFVFLATTALNSPFISEFSDPIYIVPVLCGAAGGIVGANLRK